MAMKEKKEREIIKFSFYHSLNLIHEMNKVNLGVSNRGFGSNLSRVENSPTHIDSFYPF